MEDIARKAEKEKLAELEAMLADATLSGDMTDDSSGSFVSDVATPEHHQASLMAREDRATDPRPAWCPVYRDRWSDAGNDCFAVTGERNLTEDVTAQAFSSSFNSTESSPRQRDTTRSRRNLNRKNKYERSDHQPRAGQDAVVVELRSKLAATRAELERKEVVSRSLQRQLHQREEIEAKNQAKAEEDLVAAVAKASGLKEELARTSQLLVDGAVARQQLEQRCAVLEEDLQKSAAKAKELEGEAFDARVEVMKVTGVLRSQRGDGVLAVERAYGKELQRMQECAKREAQALKHEASNQRTTLEEMRTQFTKACGERDAWREEAEAHTSEAESLRETVSALRKNSENETIGALLGQISRWKRRAEELEHLQQRSPVNPDPFDSISETSSSVDSASVSPRPFGRSHDAGETSPGGRAEIPTVSPCKEGEDERSDVALAAEAAQTTIEKLERELSKVKEALSIAEEEAATARRENAEEKLKRTAAESRVKALEWGEIETENQAIAQKEQVAEAAKASGLKEELKRSTQLLMDGAVVRQQLEQRCSVLEQDLKKSAARTTELERELRNARAELVKVSEDLHSQRGTDVVEVERAYGDKLERIQETSKCEARALKHEARAQRDALKEMRIQFTKACGERDSWREEAQAHASEAKNLQETVNALRKYSEDEMIDALLGQISRWKQRAEELEHLQQRSPVNPDAFDSISETISSVDSASVSPRSPGRSHDAGETIPDSLAEISTESPCKRGEDVKPDVGLAAQVTQAVVEKMGKELSEAKEALSIAEAETATARRENAEEKLKRTAAESRVKAIEIEAQANAEAARKSLSARREAKAKAFEQLKFTIRQEMVAELNRLRCEVEDQKQAERSQANAAVGQTCKCLSSNPQPLFLDKSCQISESSIYCGSCQKADPASTCCIAGDSSVAETRIVVSAAAVTSTEEADKRLEAAAAAAATAETLAASWARAFSSATAMIHSALATLRDLANSVLGEKGDKNKTYIDLKIARLGDPIVEESPIIAVPWVLPVVPMDVGTEGVLALEALRGSIKSTAEGVRLALARSATRIAPAASAVKTASLIMAGTQTDDRGSQAPGGLDGVQCEFRRRTIGVQAGLGEERPVKMSKGCAAIINTSNSEAPAWERGGPAPGWVVPRQSGDFSSERRWREKDDAMVERLRRKTKKLGEEMRRSQKEKDRLEQSLKQQEREKAIELKHQRALHQSQIQELHDSAMAIVHEENVSAEQHMEFDIQVGILYSSGFVGVSRPRQASKQYM